MKTIALDQNKWIEIAIAWTKQEADPFERKKLFNLVELSKLGKARFPLTFSNIYETMKISDARRRSEIAYVQAVLSKGTVFVGRTEQRQKEVKNLLRTYFGLPSIEEDREWYLSNRFWEAVEPTEALSNAENLSSRLLDVVDQRPAEALYSYLTELDNDTRTRAVRQFSAGIREMLAKIEVRRKHHRQHSLSIRRKSLSVYMFMDNQDHFWKAVDELAISTDQFRQSDDSLKRDLIRSVPCLYIERELALKIEAEDTEITENDARDISFMCTTLPYADVVIAERPFTQRTKQADLHKKFSTEITSELSELPSLCLK